MSANRSQVHVHGYTWIYIHNVHLRGSYFSLKTAALGELCCVALPFFLSISWMIEVMIGIYMYICHWVAFVTVTWFDYLTFLHRVYFTIHTLPHPVLKAGHPGSYHLFLSSCVGVFSRVSYRSFGGEVCGPLPQHHAWENFQILSIILYKFSWGKGDNWGWGGGIPGPPHPLCETLFSFVCALVEEGLSSLYFSI